MKGEQIKSRSRVKAHGEVFTAEREVKAMCDLVREETERVDSRFLEPACGDGNFLAEILTRKLAVVKKKYGKSFSDYEKNAVLAVSSLYGVDILADSRAGTCMVFVPAGRDTGYSILPDSTETHIQSGDKETGYNRREYILMRITEDIRYLYPRCLRS